jgi:4'-phosphopantetheinyl transferase
MQPILKPFALPIHAPNDIRAWLIEIDLDSPLDIAGAGVLSEHELARARRFLRHADAARFATVRAAMRHVLGAHLSMDAARVVIESDASGRPRLAMPGMSDAPDFNVSHSGAFGAIVLSARRRVGIDIEEARVSLNWRELESAVFADADRRALDALPEAAQRGAFFECWTAKEAVLKAHGTGMGAGALSMTAFSVLPRAGERYALSPEAGAFAAAPLPAPHAYSAALAWSL